MAVKCCEHSSAFISNQIFFILAGNKDNHKISDEFEIQQDSTMDCAELPAIERLENGC